MCVCEERTNGFHCLLPLLRLGQPSGRSHAVGTDHTEGVRDGAGWRRREPRGHETVPGEGGAYWSLCVPTVWAGGSFGSGLPQEPLWGHQTPEILNEGRQAILPDLPLHGFWYKRSASPVAFHASRPGACGIFYSHSSFYSTPAVRRMHANGGPGRRRCPQPGPRTADGSPHMSQIPSMAWVHAQGPSACAHLGVWCSADRGARKACANGRDMLLEVSIEDWRG